MRANVLQNEQAATLAGQGEQSLANLLEEVTQALDAGAQVDIDEIVAAHPQHAERLRELMATMLAMASWGRAPDSKGGTGAAPTAGAPLEGVLGDFRILKEIGRGGMGTVYEAEQISMGRRVALKVLPFAGLAQDKALQRFRNEVRAAAALDHPNIVSVYAVGEERGIHYYAMRLVRGQSLADRICQLRRHLGRDAAQVRADAPTIDSAETGTDDITHEEQAFQSTVAESRHDTQRYRIAANWGIQAAEALQHAHDQGVLHRDIKPGNLLLDAEGQLYVTDFGLARIEADAGLTMTGDIVGTLRYMAPEQALAKRVVIDHRADIYGLGATLYELLTLQPAFGETDRSELLKQIAFEEPTSLRKIDRDIPLELETIVLKAMAKSPDERYETAQDLADDLQAYLEDRPIAAKPPTLLQLAGKWSRRHVGMAWTAAVAALLLAVLSAIGTGVLAESRRQALDARQKAEAARADAETEAARSQQIAQLMKGMLQGVGPGVAKGRDTTLLREILDQTSQRLDDDLTDQPEVEADLRETLGTVYHELGEYSEAEAMCEKALELRKKTSGAESLDTARILKQLGDVYFMQYRSTDAEAAYQESIRVFRKIHGSEHSDVATSLAALADSIRRDPLRRPEAEAIQREALAMRRQLLGDESLDVADSLIRLGVAIRKDLRGEKTECYAEALRIRQKLLGRTHPLVATSLMELGASLHDMPGHEAEGELLLRDALAIRRDVLGEHRDTAMTLHKLCSRVDDPAEAESLCREALAIRKKVLRDGHPEIATSTGRLVKFLIKRDEQAELAQLLNDWAPRSANEFRVRGQIHRKCGEFKEAIEDYSKSIDLDPESPHAWWERGAVFQHDLGEPIRADADYSKAIELNPTRAMYWKSRGVTRFYSLRQSEEAIDDYSRALELNGNVAEYWFVRGVAYRRVGELSSAIDDMTQAIEIEPDNIGYWINRSQTYHQVQQVDLALDDLEQASELAENMPPDADRSATLASGFAAVEEWDTAAAHYAAALELEPDAESLWYGRALCLLAANDLEGYRETCTGMAAQFFAVDDKDLRAWVMWTLSLAPTSIDDFSLLVPLEEPFEDVVESEETMAAFHLNSAGAALYRNGQFDASIKQFTAAELLSNQEHAAVSTSSAYTLYFLVMAHHQLGHAAEAERYLAEANVQAEAELNDSANPPPWNRRLTLQLLRNEAEQLILDEGLAESEDY